MVDIVNAAPMLIDLGTKDSSTRVLPSSSLDLPQHLPKIYLFAEKGPMGSHYLDLNQASLTKVYGDATFDVNKKYYTHQTLFAQAVASAGNSLVVHRLAAPDAKDVANLALYLDVLPTQVPLYVKNSDGSLALDTNGNPVPQLDSNGDPILVNGYKVAWVLDKTVANIGTYQRGLLTTRNGLQVDGSTQSTQYPIFEFAAADPGEFGNKLAVRLYAALKSDLVPFPDSLLSDGKMYPYYFQMYQLVDDLTGKTAPVLNSFGGQYAKFVAKPKGVDPSSGAVVDLTKVVTDQYINLNIASATGLGTVYTYASNLETVLTMLYDAEKIISDSHRDAEINNTEANIYALNIMSFTSSNGSPYQAVKLVDITGSTRLTKNTNLFLSGSSDGTISLALLDSLVAADMNRYADPLDEYQDLVMHPESCVYDSGFTLNTKKSLFKMLSLRKDTYIFLSTFAHDAAAPTLSDQYSVGVALKTYGELFPESAYFGTPVMRASIWGGAGYLINGQYSEKVPLTYEVVYKFARLAGAGNAAWNPVYLFDKAPNSVITQLKDIDVTWVPASTRNTLWSVGINFVLKYTQRQAFFPAAKTIYENDTSVLNSVFTVVAISYLHKVLHSAWREFSGAISYTNNQLVERINNFIAAKVKDKFAGLFVIVPDAKVTEEDALRGYSITVNTKIYANNMKTVHVSYVESFRMEDLVQ